jgi:hypothetical protein
MPVVLNKPHRLPIGVRVDGQDIAFYVEILAMPTTNLAVLAVGPKVVKV